MLTSLDKYDEYVRHITKKIDSYFDEQREFIMCKAGCGICCKASYYPASALEYQYLKIALNKLNPEKKAVLNQKCLDIYRDLRKFLKQNPDIMKFAYHCPLLINDSCSVYEHRPLMCRAHGLIYIDVAQDNKVNSPYCMMQGLNYSNVWDAELKGFSLQKAESLGLKNKPKAYDLSYSSLLGGLEFGDVRMLYEWIISDIPNYHEILEKIKKDFE